LAVATRQDLLSPQGTDWLLLLSWPSSGDTRPPDEQLGAPHVPAFLLSVMLLAVPVIAA